MEDAILIALLIGFLILLAVVVSMMINNWLKGDSGKIDER